MMTAVFRVVEVLAWFDVCHKSRSVRRSTEPFGGIQLIVCGDFLQLPPVSKGKEKANFCFQVRMFNCFRYEATQCCVEASFTHPVCFCLQVFFFALLLPSGPLLAEGHPAQPGVDRSAKANGPVIHLPPAGSEGGQVKQQAADELIS